MWLKREILFEIIRFGIVGGIATVLHYGVYWLLHDVINVNLAYTVGYYVSFIANYLLSARFTFNKKKTDKRDAQAIARALKNHEYSEVYMPDEEDEAVRDYIRMMQDHKKQLRVIKQQICAFTTRHGYRFTDGKNYWIKKHMKWLKELPLEGMNKETIDAYLLSYETITDRLDQMNKRIEEIAETDKYREAVHKLICFKSVKVLTALAVIVEIGDFTRFVKAKNLSALQYMLWIELTFIVNIYFVIKLFV